MHFSGLSLLLLLFPAYRFDELGIYFADLFWAILDRLEFLSEKCWVYSVSMGDFWMTGTVMGDSNSLFLAFSSSGLRRAFGG